MNPLIYSLDLTGTFVFALSGGLAAARSRLDPFGFVVITLVTGLGGGTLRNLLLDLHPVTWIADPHYLGVCIVAALAGSIAYVLLDAGDAHPLVSAAVAFSVCAGLRLAAIRWNLSLPAYGGGRMS